MTKREKAQLLQEVGTQRTQMPCSTTIQISRAVRAQLCSLGMKGESYNDILLRLLAQAAKKPKGKGGTPLSAHGG